MRGGFVVQLKPIMRKMSIQLQIVYNTINLMGMKGEGR